MQAFHDVELPEACIIVLAGDIHQDVCHARECKQLVFGVCHFPCSVCINNAEPSLTQLDTACRAELKSLFGDAVPEVPIVVLCSLPVMFSKSCASAQHPLRL